MILSQIANDSSHNYPKAIPAVKFSEIIDLYELISQHGNSSIHASLNSVLLRIIEIGILHDSKIQRIGDLWNSLGNEAENKLRERLSEILSIETHKIPENLLTYIKKILIGSAFQRGRREINQGDFFGVLVEKNIKLNKLKQLHCASCGYRFQEPDMGRERLELAKDFGAIFNTPVNKLRLNNIDLWKPHFNKNAKGDHYLTYLTIDHIIPEEGLGGGDPENLQITCKLCNNGKMAYRRPLEAISIFAAGGLGDYPSDRGWNFFKQSVVSFAFEFYGRKCFSCNIPSSDVELTVRPIGNEESENIITILAPWNFKVVCYDCLSKNLSI
jgi:5-methylcytosine-specific restriction endonuclease McrA